MNHGPNSAHYGPRKRTIQRKEPYPVPGRRASDSNAPEHSTAYYFLEGLNEIGVEHLFCNFGTDHAPIIEEMAGREKRGEKVPNVVLCPHENTAAHMAGGYALVTGQPQGVLVHVDVGTANSGNAMHNLFRSRIPVLLMAGKAPFTAAGELIGSRDTYVHFVQEPFDQGSLVRPYVKWEWTLPSGVVVKEALRRAHNIMSAQPQGPVYMMMQRETLTQHWNADEVRSFSGEQFSNAQAGGADPAAIAQLADRLLKAEHPILITGYAGRNARTCKMIEELAEFAGVGVFQGNMTFNINHEHPCFVGFSADKHLPKTDLGLLVDVDVPWFATDVKPNDKAFFAHIDVDVLKPASPMWTFPGHLRMQGDSGRILEQLLEELKKKATPAFNDAAKKRVAAFTAERDARRENAKKLAANKGKHDEIGPHYIMSELNKLPAGRGHRVQRGDPQHRRLPVAAHAAAAELLRARGRRRSRLVRRLRARRQARQAGEHDGAGGRRRQLLLRRPELDVLGGAAIQPADLHHRARQHRLVGGEGIDAARVPAGRSQDQRQVPREPDARRRLHQDRRGLRRLRRAHQQP